MHFTIAAGFLLLLLFRWGDGKKGKKTVKIVKDGHEADSESEGIDTLLLSYYMCINVIW